MTVSRLRTLVIGLPPATYGVPLRLPLRRWPLAEPEDLLDYSIDISPLLADVGDTIVSTQVSVSPSGLGDLAASNLSVLGGVVTVWLSGGLPGRDYVIQIAGQTVGQRSFGFRIGLAIDGARGGYPNLPPLPGFGQPIVWGDPALSNLLLGADNDYLLGADGAALTFS